MDYPFENLTPEKFQEFCQALLAKEFPDVQCFPVGQPDGGRDALSYYLAEDTRNFIVYQVKYVRQPYAEQDPHLWLLNILEKELPKVRKLIASGAKKYVLITNVSGTAHLNSGSIDKVHKLLNEGLGIGAICWWRDDLNRRLDNAWGLKWIYPELMTGPDLIRTIIENGLSEDRERRTAAIRAFIQDQFSRDEDVRFKQVDLQHKLLDLFIDLPIVPPENPASKKQQIQFAQLYQVVSFELGQRRPRSFDFGDEDFYLVRESSHDYVVRPSREERATVGAATLLLHRAMQEFSPRIVLEGAPGQGKSTITHSPYAAKRAGCNSRRASNATCTARRYSFDLSAKWLRRVEPLSSSSLM